MSSDNGIGPPPMGKQEDMDMLEDGRSPSEKGNKSNLKALNRVSSAYYPIGRVRSGCY